MRGMPYTDLTKRREYAKILARRLRKENPQASRNAVNKYHAAHPEKAIARSQRRSPEKRRAYQRAHPEIFRCANAKYKFTHPEKFKAVQRKAARKKYLKHGAVIREARRIYCKKNLAKIVAANARYEAAKLRATPSWFESKLVAAVYSDANKKQSHVDHIVPLKSKLVCGLHCLANLQILTPLANLSKGNRYWPDMP